MEHVNAIQIGQHTAGGYGIHENKISISADQTSGSVSYDEAGLRLEVHARVESAEMLLTVTKKLDHSWPPLAAIIPCFNPGPEASRKRQFANTNTFFLRPAGLHKHVARESHYNSVHRSAIDDETDEEGKYLWSSKWPKSEVNSYAGLMLREATDAPWVTGIAWERFLSTQGHNSWECMHLSKNVGALSVKVNQGTSAVIFICSKVQSSSCYSVITKTSEK